MVGLGRQLASEPDRLAAEVDVAGVALVEDQAKQAQHRGDVTGLVEPDARDARDHLTRQAAPLNAQLRSERRAAGIHRPDSDGLLTLLAGRTASLDRHEPEDPVLLAPARHASVVQVVESPGFGTGPVPGGGTRPPDRGTA